ncbi:MAG: hypothetical protein IMZ47_09410 [Firmicutes bacterium]|nr:hypothetical protein [Bacillota bacterium]
MARRGEARQGQGRGEIPYPLKKKVIFVRLKPDERGLILRKQPDDFAPKVGVKQ